MAERERLAVRPAAVIEALKALDDDGHLTRHRSLTTFELHSLIQAWCDTELTRRELRATLAGAGLKAGDRGAGYQTFHLYKAILEGGALQQLLAHREARNAELVKRVRAAAENPLRRRRGQPDLDDLGNGYREDAPTEEVWH